MLRAPFPLHTCHRQYPGAAIAGTTLLFSRNDLSLPRIDWQVGPHITLFEACSAFTHVAACILAKSPSDPLHRRLQPLRYLHDCSGCFRREQKSPGGIRTRRKGATFSWRTTNSSDHVLLQATRVPVYSGMKLLSEKLVYCFKSITFFDRRFLERIHTSCNEQK